MEIVLYYAPITCAMAPWLSLTEAGAEFETRPINTRKRQQMTPEYLALNPKHKVPLLLVDGRPLTENPAIHTWIARAFPEARLMPEDPWDELQALSLIAWSASGIHPYLSRINNPARVCDIEGTADNVIAHASHHLDEVFGIADARLEGHDYFFDRFTAPDTYFFWACRRATQFDYDLSKHPNVAGHFERMQTRDSVKQLFAFEKQVQDSFAAAA